MLKALRKLNQTQAIILGVMLGGVIVQLYMLMRGETLSAVFMAPLIALGPICLSAASKKKDGGGDAAG